MQDWMILVLAIAVLGVAFIVVSRDKPAETSPHPWPDADDFVSGPDSPGGDETVQPDPRD